MSGLNRQRRRVRYKPGIPEDALEIEATRRLIRFELARLEISRIDLSSGLPCLDMIFSYVYAQEGEFRAKSELLNSMGNITSALMLTISLPVFFAAASSDLAEESSNYRVFVYLQAIASCCFLWSLSKTSNWVTAGSTFVADDLDALTFNSKYYPSSLAAGSVIGTVLMFISMVFYLSDILSHTPVSDRYILSTIICSFMIFSCFRNSSYEWAYVYKKVAGFPTVFWDASSTDRFVSVTAAPQAGRVKKCARVNATDYTRRYDAVTKLFVPVVTESDGEDWMDVSYNLQAKKLQTYPDMNDQDNQCFTTNIRDKVDAVRRYYDIPTEAVEPEPVCPVSGLNRLVSRYFLNGSGMVDNPTYIQWLLTWQLKPEWRRRLENHLPLDTIELRRKAPPAPPAPPPGEGLTGFGVDNKMTGFGVTGGRAWPEIVTEACGSACWSTVGAQLSRIPVADLECLTFANKIIALKDLGLTDPAIRIRIANKC